MMITGCKERKKEHNFEEIMRWGVRKRTTFPTNPSTPFQNMQNLILGNPITVPFNN